MGARQLRMVIAITAQKGGVGKTSTSISLSSYLARKGFKVLVIDIDAQGNLSQVLLDNYSRLPKDQTVASILLENDALVCHEASRVPNLHVCPSHDELSVAESLLSTLPARERRLHLQLEGIRDQFDFIFIDCPPNVNELPKNAYVAADYLLIPFQADTFNIKGLTLVLNQMEKMIKYNDSKVKVLGLLSVAFDQRANISKEIYTDLVKRFGKFAEGGWVFKTKLPVNNAITYSHGSKQDIFEFEPNSPIAKAYKSFIENELLPHLLNKNNE
jgi:chromosome partitioning protein